MWTKAQGQAVGKIVSEYRENPANAKKKLSTEVIEAGDGHLYLSVQLGREENTWMILQDGTAARDF